MIALTFPRKPSEPMLRPVGLALLVVAGLACGGQAANAPSTPTSKEAAAPETAKREAPPASGKAKDVAFPTIVRQSLDNGLELNVVEDNQLPLAYVRLVVRSGLASDPADQPGMAKLVAQMLKEGTRNRSSATIADEVEFLGADLHVHADEDVTHVMMQSLSDHFEKAMELVSDVALAPSFRADELKKLQRREKDRLARMATEPRWLVRRTFLAELYGNHPYAHFDTTPDVVAKVKRTDLAAWHRTHFVPSNAFLVVVGNVSPETVKAQAERYFGKWSGAPISRKEVAIDTKRSERQVLILDRPDSVQSMIFVGHLSVARNNPDWVTLQVANQVLGGSAASRLFMDLREKRSLTYGAYSVIDENVETAPFRAITSVRTEVTGEALQALFEHLDRIITEAAPQTEIADAQRFLSDSFPLQIDTPSEVAGAIAQLRIFGLPDDYWSRFRSDVRKVGSADALGAAKRHIRPEQALVVIVGNAAAIVEDARKVGKVQVLDLDGNIKESFAATPSKP